MQKIRLSVELSAEEIQARLDAANPGDCFVFEPGVYRGCFQVTRSGTAEAPICLEAELPGQTVFTGTDLIKDWAPDAERAGVWVAECDLSAIPPETKFGPLLGRREQVFVDGIPLRQVLHADQMKPGCFRVEDGRVYFSPDVFTGEERGGELEVDAGAITGGGRKTLDRSSPENCWPFLTRPFDPAAHRIEVTTRGGVFTTGVPNDRESVSHLQIRGLVFRGSGDAPQQCMARFCGQHLRIENCLFEYGAARGFDLRCDHSVMRGCVTRLNGQMGFSGYGDHNLLEDCALLYNNTRHSDFVCFEQGGSKIVRAGHWRVRRVRCVGNDGPGIWFDIDNHDIVIEQCWCEGNSGPGIMYEISRDADIRNNVCLNNGHAYQKDVRFNSIHNSVGHVEPVYGQGILVQMSRNVRVYNNTCVGNRRCGVELRHHPYQQAGNPGHSKETYRMRDNEVFNNVLADNSWNNLMVSQTPANPVKAGEVLNNRHDYNLYHTSAALTQHEGCLSAYCRWGKTQHAGSMSLEEWRAMTHQDMHSIQWDPFFKAPAEKDFRVEPVSPVVGRGKPVEGLEVDYAGNPRPDRPAIGAFEACDGFIDTHF
ncbi:MAG: right-handed parallel beta-helix repeat-containing protein [Verrucomicrobia bacterium]|nr:right-handed parallel beta-helix repeat-containing protein [Verrucomicrobiota bacterium]MCH8527482.1 right-handed parallel beta-helix repeat-containing protein [Kiritimatiellia bacterium]